VKPPAVHDGEAAADVCLVLEGTYPYVKGGVSTWVHDLISSLAEFRFALVHVGPESGTYTRKHYSLPANVISLSDLYCREPLARGGDADELERVARAERRRHAHVHRPSRVLHGIRRLHLDDSVDPSLLDDLASGDLSVGAFLHGRETFEVTAELCERLAPEASFLDFFWHFRSMHLPLIRLLSAEPPEAATYHAVCTGYAGLLAAVWSRRADRPLLLTEHGIYTRERLLELDRAAWLRGVRVGGGTGGADGAFDSATSSALRRLWANFFRTLAICAYARASTVVSLCEVSRRRQIADGAPADRTLVVPNGIDLEQTRAPVVAMRGAKDSSRAGRLRGPTRSDQGCHHAHSRMLSGFAGRPRGGAHLRPDGRRSALRSTVSTPGGETGSGERGPLRIGASDRTHLPRDRHPGPHQLQ
jgi:hypothetical protein